MKIQISIPCMDTLDTEFVRCLMAMKRIGECHVAFLPNSLIYDSRNKLSAMAINSGSDYMLWLDSDMVFEQTYLEQMMDSIGHDDYLCSLFFGRRPPFKPCIFSEAGYKLKDISTGEMEQLATNYFDYPAGKFEVAASGFAGVLMKTDMIRKIYEKKGLPFSPILGFGEDISFGIKARESGFHLYCDSRIKMGHLGTLVVDEDVSRAFNGGAANGTAR